MTTPLIGATGEYQVRSPYTTTAGGIYKCAEVSSISALASNLVDVYLNYYEPYGLAPSHYITDKDNEENIVHLASTNGNPDIFIPSSYIVGIPSGVSIPYSRVLLSVDLGLLPDRLPLASLMDDIKNLSSDVIGVDPTVKQHIIPILGGVDTRADNLLEINRNLAIRYRSTAYADVKRLTGLLTKKDEYIALLEEALRQVNRF